jgi:hypothetical protein
LFGLPLSITDDRALHKNIVVHLIKVFACPIYAKFPIKNGMAYYHKLGKI